MDQSMNRFIPTVHHPEQPGPGGAAGRSGKSKLKSNLLPSLGAGGGSPGIFECSFPLPAISEPARMLSRIFRHKPFADPSPTLANVPYGRDCGRQKLDFWAGSPDSGSPVPALIFFHGGGFVRGSKFFCKQMHEVRERGGVAISVNYRFLRKPGSTIARSMDDSRRVLDFVRERAGEWNIDPNRIALHGKSSGGCIALWLAMKENLRGVTTHNTPTSLDPELLVEIGKRRIEAFLPIWGPMSGTWRSSELNSPRVRKLVEDYSPLHQAHPASPPLYLHYTSDQPLGRIGWLHALHSVRYGELMKERYDQLGLSCELASPSRPPGRPPLEFLCEVLGLPAEPIAAVMEQN